MAQTRSSKKKQQNDPMARRRGKNKRVDAGVKKKVQIAIIVGFLALVTVMAYDAFPLFAARGTIQDRAEQAAAKAASAVKGKPLTTATAGLAYGIALQTIDERELNIDIDEETFKVNADGSVTFTATQEVPSLLLKKYPMFTDMYDIKATVSSNGTILGE